MRLGRWQVRLGRRTAEAAPLRAWAVLECACGTRWQCQREAHGRTIDCPKCGAENFVLAATPLGTCTPPRGQAAIDWEPQGEAAEPAPAVPLPDPARTAPEPAQPTAPKAEWPDRPVEEHWVEDEATARARWSTWSVRLIAVSLLALVAITGGLSWRAYRQRVAAAQLEQATQRGYTALQQGDYLLATSELRLAAGAAAALPGETAAQRRAIRLAREAEAWSNMAASDLGSFWLSRTAASKDLEEATLRAAFEPLFAGRAVVFDASILREFDPDWAARLRAVNDVPLLRMDWAVEGPAARLEIVLPPDLVFAGIKPGAPRRMVFAGRIADLRRAGDVWLLSLVPGSCVLLSESAPLERCGFPLDAELTQLLEAQASFLGGQP